MEILGRSKAIISKFKKAIELLGLKFAPTFSRLRKRRGFAKNFSLHRKKYALPISAVLILVVIGLVIPQGPAVAGFFDWVGTGLLSFVYVVVYYIFFVLFYIAYYIAYFAAGMLNINLNPEIMRQVLTSPAITNGWAIFRDIANLFFILILLFIAIGTIVRSQSYNLKNLLPKLIIAVFLINFSNVIAGVIIDFGNIFMYGVLKWMSCGAGNNTCASDFFRGLMDVIDGFDTKYGKFDGLSASAEATVGIVIATIYTLLYGLILLALGVFLMIRIAAFAILIILSPLAFVGEVFPGMKELSSEWWKNLVNYTLFGPIFALLLYVSGLMAQEAISVPVPSFYSAGNPALGTFGTLYVTIIQNIIPLIFLLAIIPITQKLGIAGANAVFSSVGGLAKSVGASTLGHIDRFMARGAGMTGTGRYAKLRRGLSTLSYGAYQRAGKAHKADREKDYDVATGAARNRMETATFGNTGVDYEKRAKAAKAELEFKAEGITNTDEMIDKVKKDLEDGINPELNIKRIKWLAAEGATDDLLERDGKERGAQGLSDFTQEHFDKSSATGYKTHNEEDLSKLASDIHKAEQKNGNVGYAGVGKYDTTAAAGQKYKFNRMSGTDPATRAAAIADQQNEQIKAAESVDIKNLKKESFLNRAGGITDAGKKILENIKGEKLNRIKTWNRKDAEAIHNALAKLPAAQVNADLDKTWKKIKTDFGL